MKQRLAKRAKSIFTTQGGNPMLKFSGINISSYDTKKMTEFYRDKLGLPVIGDEFEAGRDYESYDGIMFGNKEGEPKFWIWDANEWAKPYDGNVCLIFNCEDLDKLFMELKGKGVELDPPKTADWGGQELVIKDPDGNTIIVL
jgi:catechol 2,3-dioxygenase-like lactoylglutathione lyase family enzyme